MTFQQTVDYLYSRLPVFQFHGARAYKPGLGAIREFCDYLGNPQEKFKSIHIAGTNGKGSTSHMMASVLQKSGYKVGLYTSPHLISFTERIRIDGREADQEFVIEFVEQHAAYMERVQPSFFEVTVAMAFEYFAREMVDIAVVEVGMGGRLDSTNVIIPEVCIITNISFDHTQHLGDTLPKIAFEKAGIIKSGVPVVLSEEPEPEVFEVFLKVASEAKSPLFPAYKLLDIKLIKHFLGKQLIAVKWFDNNQKTIIELDLTGDYQLNNCQGVLVALRILQTKGFQISDTKIMEGLSTVTNTTGLKGRWQSLQSSPLVICDTAHNYAGLRYTMEQFNKIPHQKARFILGFLADKDLESILLLFPKNGMYYFCQPSNLRALSASLLASIAETAGLQGNVFDNVNSALEQAIQDSTPDDIIYVGGSTFVVADLRSL